MSVTTFLPARSQRCVLTLIAALLAQPAGADPIPYAQRDDGQAFIREMGDKHGFAADDLLSLFGSVYRQDRIIELMERPRRQKPAWYTYSANFLTPQRIQGGAQFLRDHRATLRRAEETYGVPPNIVTAILGVETAYGRNTGSIRVIDALATLAFDYPRRAPYFRSELENYLVLTRNERVDPASLKGSYAGAMGMAQFMPGSFLRFAVDFDEDGRRDIWRNHQDIIGSVANYFREHGWQAGQPVAVRARLTQPAAAQWADPEDLKPVRPLQEFIDAGVEPTRPIAGNPPAMLFTLENRDGIEYWLGFDNFYAITRYNRSILYAMTVFSLSQAVSHPPMAPQSAQRRRPKRN